MISIIFFIILLIIFLTIYKLYKDYKINIFLTLLCTLLIFYIIYNPSLCINATLKGVKIFFNSVFAPLFIFIILSNIIIQFDGINIYSKIFGHILCHPFNLPKECSMPIIISLISGYPLGAKYSCDLYSKKIIDRKTCQNLLNIASNPSPIFIIATIGITMLHNVKLGYILLISNYLSCLIMAILLKGLKKRNLKCKFNNQNYTFKNTNIGKALKESIDNAIYTSLSIGGFITFFIVLITILENNKIFIALIKSLSYITNIPYYNLEGFLFGLLEMTNGCYIISSSNSISIYLKLIIISFFTSFSGISIILQVNSFIYKHNLCIKKYIFRKLIQGLICILITSILYWLFFNKLSASTISINTYNNYTKQYFYYILFCIITVLFPLILNKIQKSLHIS